VEEEESSNKHQEHYSSHCDIEIPPTLVLIFVAACYPRSNDITGEKFRITRILRVSQESPCDCNKIS